MFVPVFCFYVKLKKHKKDMEYVRVKLGFDDCFSINFISRYEGLAILWNSDVNIDLKSYSRWHIDMVVQSDSGLAPWCFNGFYGEPDHSKLESSWNLMRQLFKSQNCLGC